MNTEQQSSEDEDDDDQEEEAVSLGAALLEHSRVISRYKSQIPSSVLKPLLQSLQVVLDKLDEHDPSCSICGESFSEMDCDGQKVALIHSDCCVDV
jgi:hypothetical protein